MRKGKEWLKGLINEEGIVIDMNLLGRLDEQYWKNENIKINKGRLFYLIDQLDEPEKVVIPLFVAEHIIRQKELTATLLQAIGRIKLSGTEMVNWITTDGNDVLFCKAWLYGYEVEKEILWEIPLPDLKTSDGDIQYLTYDHKAKTYFASRRNAQLKQAFNAKDLASVPTPHRHYAVLCDFNKKSRR